MTRRLLAGLGIAAVLIALLAVTVAAQDDPEAGAEAAVASIEPFEASIVEAVPISLTVHISGATGMQTVVVPLTLNVDIRLGFGTALTASVAATTEAVLLPAPPATEEVEEATPEPTEEPPTPTPRPRTVATATPRPAATSTTVTATATPTVTVVPTVEAAICPDAHAVITSPGVNEVLSGQVDIIGTAQHENFNYYKLEYTRGADPNAEFAYLTDVHSQVANGLLGTFDTTAVDNGLYMLRLTVVDNTGNFPPPCTVTVAVEN